VPALALIFAMIDTPDNDYLVGVTEVGRALDWYEYLRTHAERIYQSASLPQVGGARTILKKIKSKEIQDGFTPREIAQKHWTGLGEVEAVRKAIAVLVDYNYVRKESLAHRTGRPSESYLINPKVLEVRNEI
jgi:putative DNA primase/helicase